MERALPRGKERFLRITGCKRWWGVFILLSGAVCTVASGGATPEFRAKNATFLFVDHFDRPLARLRLGELLPDYQTRWFFRIGVLPTVAGREVRLELLQTNISAESFALLTSQLRRRPARQGIEFREFSCYRAGEKTPCLEAGRLRLDAEGRWRLSGGVRWRGDQTSSLFSEGTVRAMPGGEIQFDSPGRERPFIRTLFPPAPSPADGFTK